MRRAGILFIFLAMSGHLRSLGQALPLGQWQSHFNYLSAREVVDAGARIYCASYNGLFSINPANGETRVLSKADGLSQTGIAAMGYQPEAQLLLLAYRNGVIDFVYLDEHSEPEQIETWDLLNNTPGLPEDKAIRHIAFRNGSAYMATGFGILVLDTQLRQVEETYRYIGPGGTQSGMQAVAFSGDSVFVNTTQGTLLAASMGPEVNRQYFANWKMLEAPGKVSDVTTLAGVVYGTLPGKGIYSYTSGKWTLIYPSASPNLRFLHAVDAILATTGQAIVRMGADGRATVTTDPSLTSVRGGIQANSNTLWLADAKNGLVSNRSGAFEKVSPTQGDTTIAPRPDSLIVDLNGLSWSRLPETLGGGILVTNADGSRKKVLSTSIGSGSLPANKINSLAIDQDGYIWFASARGAGYLIPDGVLEAGRVDVVLPLYGQRKLFNNEECTALAVESGNRKWIGTRTGLYQFNADGTELIRKFTAADSPLPSDHIRALRFEASSGLLFADTPGGMVSYQTDAKAPEEHLGNITIFPNPVRPGYGGTVGISGLTGQSTVKITDLSGRLVFEGRSEGGLASWNLNDYTGRRARAGIYIVFIVSADGSERQAGKLAIIN